MGVAVTALIFASLLPVALSVCSCGNTTILIPFSLTPTNIFNPKDDTDGKPCAMDCTYTLTYTGTPNDRSLSLNYVYFNPATDNAECLTIYDGAGTSGSVICPQNCDTAPDDPCVSNSPSLTIALRTTGTPPTPATFYLIVTVVQQSGPTTTTAPSVTTTAGGGTGGPSGPCTPSNVQMDLIVLIDCSGLTNQTTFNDMKSFVDTGILSKLNIQPRDPKLTQVTASWVIPRDNLWGSTEDWAWIYNDLKIFLAGTRQWATPASPSFYSTALTAFRDATFAGPPAGSTLRRQTAPAVIYIISGSGVNPNDINAVSLADDLKNKLSAKIFTANVDALSNNNIGDLATPYLALKYNTTSDLMWAGSDDFFNIICDGNKLCGGDCGANQTIEASGNAQIQLVPNGQKYCNNMKCSWAYTMADDKTNASVTFGSIDIEFERDYIEVFDGSNMSGLALLSGYIKDGAKVTSGSPSIVIQFQSNGNNIYSGFTGTVSGVSAASEVRIYGDVLPNISH